MYLGKAHNEKPSKFTMRCAFELAFMGAFGALIAYTFIGSI